MKKKYTRWIFKTYKCSSKEWKSAPEHISCNNIVFSLNRYSGAAIAMAHL